MEKIGHEKSAGHPAREKRNDDLEASLLCKIKHNAETAEHLGIKSCLGFEGLIVHSYMVGVMRADKGVLDGLKIRPNRENSYCINAVFLEKIKILFDDLLIKHTPCVGACV